MSWITYHYDLKLVDNDKFLIVVTSVKIFFKSGIKTINVSVDYNVDYCVENWRYYN